MTVDDLFGNVSDAFTAVGNHLRDNVEPKLVPDGGTTGEFLSPTGWAVPAGGGGGGGLSRTALVLQEVLRRADATEGRTRWSFLPLTDAPTITGSTSAPDPEVFNRFHSSDISGGSMPWQVLGGKFMRQPVEGETWGQRIVTGIIELANADYPADLWTGRSGALVTQFLGDEIIFILEGGNGSYQFLVEEDGVDRFVSPDTLGVDGLGITPVGTDAEEKAYYKLSWSTVKMRKITLQCSANGTSTNRIGRFGGIYTKDHQIITRPRQQGPRIGGMGDSNIQGTNGPTSEGYLSVAFNELGLKDCWISSYGASGAYAASPGYDDPITGTRLRDGVKWSQRRQVWQEGNLDIMVWSISWNDWALISEDEIVRLEMIELDLCREQFPHMPILMIGLHTTPVEEYADETSGSGATILGTNAKMKAAIEARNDPFMKYLDTSSLYESPFQGDGSDGGHSGTGDYDIDWGPWGHYSRQGDRRIGRAISERMYDLFRDMYYRLETVITTPEVPDPVPALTPTSGSQTFTEGVAKSVDVSTVSGGTLASIASVTPALPSGLSASISGTKLRVSGTAAAAAAAATYTIVANVAGGGTLSFALNLTVSAATAPAAGYVVDVTFNGSPTDTSLTDATGNVWTPVGGATLDGVVPNGGGFECLDAELLAALAMGTQDFEVEVKFETTAVDVTLWDIQTMMGIAEGGSGGNPALRFYSAETGFIGGSMAPYGANFADGTPKVVKFIRVAGTQKVEIEGLGLSWADAANTTNYATAPTKVTLGTRQVDATIRPFIGKLYYAKIKVGS